MINIANAKPLKISNENNKLSQKEFIVIHFAPARAHFNDKGEFVRGIIESDFDRIYVIDHDGKKIFVKLKDFTRVKLTDIRTNSTMQCSGQEAYFWKMDFLKKYPKANNDTELAIYEYERVEN